MSDPIDTGLALDAQAFAAAQDGRYGDAVQAWHQILSDPSRQAGFAADYLATELPFNYSLALYFAHDGETSGFRHYQFDRDRLVAVGLPADVADEIAGEITAS